LLIATLGGKDLESYAVDVFKSWRLGQAKLDNGVLVLIVTQDRKIRVTTGYGIDHVITDGIAKTVIINQGMIPHLKKGSENWYNAVDGAITKIDGLLPSPKVDSGGLNLSTEIISVPSTVRADMTFAWIGIAIILLGIVFFWIGAAQRRRERHEAEAEEAALTREQVLRDEARQRERRQEEAAQRAQRESQLRAQRDLEAANRQQNGTTPIVPRHGQNGSTVVAAGAGAAAGIAAAEAERAAREARTERAAREAREEAARRERQAREAREESARRRRDDDDSSSRRSSSSSSSWDSGSSSSSSSSSSDSGGSFSSGGGDTGGGGASSDF
jgi:uncharacterized membrane protein YgcG